MSQRSRLAAARLRAFAIGSSVLLGLSDSRPSVAQERPDDGVEDVIVVTGSHLRRDEFMSSAPVQIISAETAAMEGLVDTGDILQSSSVAAGSLQYNNRFQNWTVEGGQGVRPISLRGLGAQRSLVLINGQRPGPSGVRGQVGSFDLNVIPASIVERYEILTDGASSIYGSDAVAGVVNVVTRTEIDGPELGFDYTLPAASGGASYSISGATGFDFGRGNVIVAAQTQQRDPVRLADRDYLSCQRDRVWDSAGNRIDWEDRSIISGTRSAGCENLYANAVIDFGTGARYIEAPDGVTDGPITGYRPRVNTSYADGGQAGYEDQIFFPFINATTVQNETTRSSVYVGSDLELEILGGVHWRNDLLANERKTLYQGFRQFFPFLGSADVVPYPNDPAYVNPLGATIAVPIIPVPQNGLVDVDYRSLATTLDGDFGGGVNGWGWSMGAVYSRSDGQYRANEILASESGDVRFDEDAPRIDYTRPEVLRGHYGPELFQTIGINTLGKTSYEQTVLSGIVTGDVARWPAGNVAVALGFEYRDYSIEDIPDPQSQAANIWDASTALVTEGQDHVAEILAEIEIPLVAGRAGVDRLTLDVSARAFDYRSYGSDDVWKAGLNWQVTPALRLRATRGTSFRAPALYELFLGDQTGFLPQNSIDPCIDWGNNSRENIRANCAAAGIPADFVGGAVAATITTGGGAGILEAETSDATTFGIVITPRAGNLSIALDYFKIDVADEVAQLGAGAILRGCYGAPVFPNEFCSLFTRDPGANPASPDAFGIIAVDDSFLNVNSQLTEGWDLNARYQRDFGFGTVMIEAQGSYTLEDVVNLFDPNLASGFETNDFNGSIGEPTFTANVRFAVSRNAWTFGWYVDFINGMDNSAFDSASFEYFGFADAKRVITTPSVRYHDVSVQWDGGATSVVFGVHNLADEDPPLISDGQALRWGNIPFFGSQYDLLGRAGFMSVTREF